MGLPTSANKTDVLRHRWMRWSVIIMHRMGLIKELIAAGFMTTDVEELPLGHPGANIIINRRARGGRFILFCRGSHAILPGL